MPNWCRNKLTVSHDDSAVLDRFVKAYNKGTVCKEFIPEPENMGEGWYNWRLNNWGTKWDIGADEGTEKEERYGLKATIVGNEASCSFDSAWSPPIGLYNELELLGFRVVATYFEPGMAFCGQYIDGNNIYVEYTNANMIPKQIWDDYNLEEYQLET